MTKELPSKKTVERFLSNYLDGSLQRRIIMREEELQYPWIPEDGTGIKVTTNRNLAGPQEAIVERKENDFMYRRWEKAYATIDLYFNELNSIERKILMLKYKEQRKWSDIATSVNYHVNSCLKIRNNLIDELQGMLSFL